MDRRDLQAGRERSLQRLSALVIEHVRAHKVADTREVVASCSWPDVDCQPLSLQDPWRLRVTAAHALAIMKSRNVQNFGKILDFLETTHKLLPRLVPAIKHMKIVFGLKTMIIMWMLKEQRGMVETVSQILRFFPQKLPQYQDQCSPREMLVMRKNHVDFRNLAQALTIDKTRLEDYIKTQMEKQYGERYAQKVEERLLHYLHLLEAELPGDTHTHKIIRTEGPEAPEDRFLLELMTSNCDAAAGRTLQHSDPALDQNPQACGEVGTHSRTQSSPPQFCSRHQCWVRSILQGCPDESSVEQQNQNRATASSSPLLFQSSSSSSSQDLTPSDLVPCPPQEPPSQTPTAAEPQNRGAGPNPSGQSSSSSGDSAPPSLLLPVIRLVDVASVWSSCSASESSSEPLALLSGKRSCSPQVLTSPHSTVPVPHMQTGSRPSSAAGSRPGSAAGSRPGSAAGSRPGSAAGSQPGSAAGSRPGSAAGSQPGSAAGSWPGSAPANFQPPSKQIISRLSRKFRHVATINNPSPSLDVPPMSPPKPELFSSKSSQKSVLHEPVRSHCQTQRSKCLVSRFTPTFSSVSSSPAAELQSDRLQLDRLRSDRLRSDRLRSDRLRSDRLQSDRLRSNRLQSDSLRSDHLQLDHLQSLRLQPAVTLTRLSIEECRQLTRRTAATKHGSSAEEEADLSKSSDSSFDVNVLYSSGSSDSEGEDWLHSDPSYRPPRKRRRH